MDLVQGTVATDAPGEPLADAAAAAANDDPTLEFVRFCYRRRHVGWPTLYDEMCAVAARGAYRGMGYAELAEQGISFCLGDMPHLVALSQRVAREERAAGELAGAVPPKLTVVPARA